MYEINGKKYDCDSTTNQNIKREFVNRSVLCDASTMVDFILTHGTYSNDAPFTYDDIENFYVKPCPYCGETYDIEEYEDEQYICNSCGKYTVGSEMEEEQQEIYDWLLVDNWFADKLVEYGEPVIRNGNICGSLWGRTCTGQAIFLDEVIGKICEEMEILEGQEHSWERNVS